MPQCFQNLSAACAFITACVLSDRAISYYFQSSRTGSATRNALQFTAVVGVGDLEPGVPGSIPSHCALVMVVCSEIMFLNIDTPLGNWRYNLDRVEHIAGKGKTCPDVQLFPARSHELWMKLVKQI